MPKLEDHQRHDIDTLTNLFTAQDPRSLEEIIAEDTEVEDHTIEQVSLGPDHGCEIKFDGGWCGFFTFPANEPFPQVGDTLRIYGSFGRSRHGFAINGKVIEYETPFERFASRITMLARFDRKRRESLEAARIDMAQWYDLLEGAFKTRIDRMRESKPDFDVDGGSYEMYPVLMAQRIAVWVKDQPEDTALDAIKRFRDLPHKDQAKVIHAGKKDKYGISGHQFDFACAIARAHCDGEDIAPPKTEDREREEYVERQANGECTCDLLSPFGHVTCAYCNNWAPSDDDEDFATLAEELGI